VQVSGTAGEMVYMFSILSRTNVRVQALFAFILMMASDGS
jgi:hypothetical protein